MASYHCTVKAKVKGKSSAAAHAKYICREGQYARGEKAESLLYKESGNMPEWAKDDQNIFWKTSDEYERANGRVYHEIEIALPNELDLKQQKELAAGYVKEHMRNDHPYTYAIHSAAATLNPGEKQPHAHIMFSERKMDGIDREPERYFKRWNRKEPENGGAEKDARFAGSRGKENILKVRQSWADHQNRALEKAGQETRVDHRTLEAQRKEALEKGETEKARKLDHPPEKHLGPKVSKRTLRKIKEYRLKDTTLDEDRLREEYYRKIEPTERAVHTHEVRNLKQLDSEIERLERASETEHLPLAVDRAYEREFIRSHGDQRTKEEKGRGEELGGEENSRRSASRFHDAERELLRSEDSQTEMTLAQIRKEADSRMHQIDKSLLTETDKSNRETLVSERNEMAKLAEAAKSIPVRDRDKSITFNGEATPENMRRQLPDIQRQVKQIKEQSKALEKDRGRER
jgi:hypothetical protein